MAVRSISPPWSGNMIRAVAQVIGAHLTGTKVGIVLGDATITDVDGHGHTKWKRIYNALVARQNKDQSGNCVIRFITEAMRPALYIDNRAGRSALQAELNEVLILEGLRVTDEGKVAWDRGGKAATLEEAERRAGVTHKELERRDAHPEVLRYCTTEVFQKNTFHAMLEASKSIPDRLRMMTGLKSDGAVLVNATLLPKTNPRVAINAGADETDHSEQGGFGNLVLGLLGMYRNTTAHPARINRHVTDEELLEALTTFSMVHRRLDSAHVQRTP